MLKLYFPAKTSLIVELKKIIIIIIAIEEEEEEEWLAGWLACGHDYSLSFSSSTNRLAKSSLGLTNSANYNFISNDLFPDQSPSSSL